MKVRIEHGHRVVLIFEPDIETGRVVRYAGKFLSVLATAVQPLKDLTIILLAESEISLLRSSSAGKKRSGRKAGPILVSVDGGQLS